MTATDRLHIKNDIVIIYSQEQFIVLYMGKVHEVILTLECTDSWPHHLERDLSADRDFVAEQRNKQTIVYGNFY